MRYSIMIALLWASASALGHSPNKAFFVISSEASGIVVDAEFPWTIRQAVIDYDEQINMCVSQNVILCNVQ